MAITTTSVLPPAIAQTYAYKLLEARSKACIHGMAVQQKTLPKGGGDTLRFRRRVPFDHVLAPLGNSGQTPPAKTLSVTTMDAKPEWYGTYTIINEQVIVTGQDPVLNMAAEGLGQCMKESDDIIIRDVLASTASFQNCTFGVNGDSPTEVTADDLAKAYKTLVANDARPTLEGLESEDKFGSYPVQDSFFALVHSDLITDLSRVDNFTLKINYSNQRGIRNSEYGAAEGFRFFNSSLGSKSSVLSANGETIYNMLMIAKDAAARVALEGNGQFLYNPPIDPLRQNCTAAVKWVQKPKILNDEYLLRVATTLRYS